MDCYNMPVSEFYDYIKLINKQVSDEVESKRNFQALRNSGKNGIDTLQSTNQSI